MNVARRVELSIRDSIALLRLNDNGKLNALSEELVNEIYQQLEDIEKKAAVLVIGSGSKKAFTVGVDINEIYSRTFEGACLDDFMDYRWERIWQIKIPVIAAVSGYALGGGFELALMCDMIVASSNAVFGFPEINIGLMPGLGGTQMLTSIVGPKIAGEIIMTGRYLKAEEAMKLGIVTCVVNEEVGIQHETRSEGKAAAQKKDRIDPTLEKALALAGEIADKSSVSTRLIKKAIRLFYDAGISGGMKAERQMFLSLFSTSVKELKVKAFLDKKKS
ncbi:MAG: enoyl-CoA hydratase/isomerase family protein [Holosporaceae bacterium]|jgi:enoyl-CoA hydratase/carnithine racemase|nr:enoyl-CoA hydratase/isomerase family protein [Holosporaceae bacterium]